MTVRTKFTFEYPLNSSPSFLYSYLTTPSGLSDWFAEDVNVNGDVFTFKWEGSEEKAKLVTKRMNKYVKFQWLDRPDEYFSFEIAQDELTGDVALVVTDFEEEEEVAAAHMIYQASIDKLRGTIGG
ncbi:MAG: START-like domain-containing protein [Bacteroidota bacterium]|nr:START-like domain-containing protein [Bacteroidota bacterium]